MKNKKMSNSSNKNKNYFSIICFSTDPVTYKPVNLIKQYITVKKYTNVVNDGESCIYYDHCSNALTGIVTQCKFYQIINLEKTNNICNKADSYIIIINLESGEVHNKIDVILKYIESNGKKDMKIYFIGLYFDFDEIKFLNNKDNIKEHLEQQNIFYEYNEIKYSSFNDIAEIISNIANDTLKNKIYDTKNISSEIEKRNKTRPKCIFF